MSPPSSSRFSGPGDSGSSGDNTGRVEKRSPGQRQQQVKKYVYFKCRPVAQNAVPLPRDVGQGLPLHLADHLRHHGEGGPPSLSLEEDSSDKFPVQRWPRCFLLEVRICSPPRNLELRRSPTTTTTVHLRGIPARKFPVVPGRDSGTDGREEDAFPQVG